MMPWTIDRTLVNLTSLLIGGLGLFAVLTDYGVPEINQTYVGENPFAKKRDKIATVMQWLFTTFALLALLLQLGVEIWGENLSERAYQSRNYLYFTLAGLVVVVVCAFALRWVGNAVARRRWKPDVIEGMTESFHNALFIVEHDGWMRGQLEQQKLSKPTTQAEIVKRNTVMAEEVTDQIEKLLDVKPVGSLKERLARLAPEFAACDN